MACPAEGFEIIVRQEIERGNLYRIRVQDKEIEVLITHHADWRARRWGLKAEEIIEVLIYPDEVLQGHGGRFIAHRVTNRHLTRIIYEYEAGVPVIVTIYAPYKERYYKGGGSFADKVLR